MIEQNEKKGLIDYCIAQAKESKLVAEMLVKNNKANSAINRIYYSIHFLLMAAAIKEEDRKISRPNDLLEWLHNKLIKPEIMPYRYYMVAKDALKDRLAADYETMVEFSSVDLNKRLDSLIDFHATFDQFMQSSSNLIPEAIAFTRKAIYWKDNLQLPDDSREALSKFYRFLTYRLFLKSKRAQETFEEYKKDIGNKKIEGSLETRFQDALQENPSLAADLKDILTELRRHKIGEPVIQTKTIVEGETVIQETILKTEKVHITEEVHHKYKETDELGHEELMKFDDVEEDEPRSNLIIVLWDFSEKADFALQHAVHFSEISGNKINLLHIVKNKKEIDEATKKLDSVCELAYKRFNLKPGYIIEAGDIFTDVTRISNEKNADMVIMGTHGIKGIQKVTGSWALKVITETRAPFVVIQDPPRHKHIRSVIFPVDQRKELKRLINQIKYLSQYYKLKFQVVKPAEFPTDDLKKRTINNFVFVKSYLKQNGKDFDVHTIGHVKDFADTIINFAKQKDVDLIMTLTTRGMTMGDLIMGTDEQKIITNKYKIPVMCVNPIKAKGWHFGQAY